MSDFSNKEHFKVFSERILQESIIGAPFGIFFSNQRWTVGQRRGDGVELSTETKASNGIDGYPTTKIN